MGMSLFSIILMMVLGVLIVAVFTLRQIGCTEPIYGRCQGTIVHSGRGYSFYYPVVEYEYGGKIYREQSLSMIKKRNRSLYENGNMKQIWVNEKNPKLFIVSKNLHFAEYMVLLSGLIMIVIALTELLIRWY